MYMSSIVVVVVLFFCFLDAPEYIWGDEVHRAHDCQWPQYGKNFYLK